ncbi:MAG: type II toxin-antitoxin system HicB family antitoxin [Dongiaceae bacterium]
MQTYIALIRKDADSDFGVEFPDFPGCVTAGRDLDEALAFAREALELHIEGLLEDGGPLPAPSGLETVMADPANAGAVAALVPAPATPTRAVRLNITLDEGLLARIDAQAATLGTTRSGFLAEAARQAIGPAGPLHRRRRKSARG